jgi:hypothetical protein
MFYAQSDPSLLACRFSIDALGILTEWKRWQLPLDLSQGNTSDGQENIPPFAAPPRASEYHFGWLSIVPD